MVAASGVATVEPPVLVPRTLHPPMQRLTEQLARRLVYIVLTAAIIVPVWLATRPHLGIVAHDPHLSTCRLNVGTATDDAAAQDPTTRWSPRCAPVSSAVPAANLSLRMNADSWVQVTAPDGRLLEHSVLHAGEERRYRAGDVGTVVLGNGRRGIGQSQGRPIDLTPYLRSNVARFTVSSDGSLLPVAD